MKKIFRIFALSDNHGNLTELEHMISNNIKGDIFIHAGDFTRYGQQKDFKGFFKALENLNFKHKIVIAGNHEISLDSNIKEYFKIKLLRRFACNLSRQMIITELKKRCIYLQNQFIQIDGLKIFGTPNSHFYSRGAFQYENQVEEELIFNKIPNKLDILITHQPPYQIMDSPSPGTHVGSKSLKNRLEAIKPKIHVFGHIHQSQGVLSLKDTIFINAGLKIKEINLEKNYD